ncbi:MAG: hypothetical protein Q7U39_10180 [Nitrospira sp.]|nr:hypothetical protein [Nitrospira sp.]
MHTTLQNTHSGDSAEPRTTMRSSILLLMAFGLIIGLILMMATRRPAVSCPEELIGTWSTAAPGYESGMLVMTKHAVVFSAGGDHLDAQAVRRLETVPEGRRVLYTLVYGNSRNEEQTLVFFYDSREQTITFKNQSHLIWTRTMVES